MQLSPQHYADAWYDMLAAECSAQKRKELSRRALNHLYRANRLGWLPGIVRKIELLEGRKAGSETVTIRASRKLAAAEAQKLASAVMGTKVASVAQKVDPELLGGVQIETANSRWDLSLRSRLTQLHNRLST